MRAVELIHLSLSHDTEELRSFRDFYKLGVASPKRFQLAPRRVLNEKACKSPRLARREHDMPRSVFVRSEIRMVDDHFMILVPPYPENTSNPLRHHFFPFPGFIGRSACSGENCAQNRVNA